MADDERDERDDEPEDDGEEREEKLFNRQEAERLLPLLETLLTTVREKKKHTEGIDQEFSQVQNRILLYGGIVPPYGYLADKKLERDTCAAALREALAEIERTGCVVKDLDLGLVDFRSIVNDEHVYLCWKLGEERIRYWHRLDEGFAGRKPLGSADASSPDAPKPN
ncbi:MAG: DUF2203 domain-containing protein [Acidobacteria bacterium]|nr:DUF2203 domain-containing protein [Acidobacteriota bacterium]